MTKKFPFNQVGAPLIGCVMAVLLIRGVAIAQLQPSTRGVAAAHFESLIHNGRHDRVSTLSLAFGMVDFPGAVASLATGANKAGHIVGGYGPNADVNLPTNSGFILKGSKFTPITYPGAIFTQPNDINDGGVSVGAYSTSIHSSDEHGFKFVSKTLTSIDYPGATEGTVAAGINKAGDIVGDWGDSATSHGFLLSKGVFTTIDYPGAFYTIAWGINNSGDIVGWYGASFTESHGFLYRNGNFTTIDYPGFSQNYVADINDSGLIVGGYGDFLTINGVDYQWEHTYLYQNGQFTTFDLPFGPPAATQVWHVSNSGIITGFYVDNSSTMYGFEAVVGP